ncbi:hypothetical protein [Streptosporangium sp. NPDC051022]|uniref:hypothetical protein n=1 Tax=Streptosporangium sp. NPDC051022 TaxID=3155752 RepID=UPI0034240264
MTTPTSENDTSTPPTDAPYVGPLDWRTGHPDSPEIRAAVVMGALAIWHRTWTP